MSEKEKRVLRKILKPAALVSLPPELSKAIGNEMPFATESADSSPPSAENIDEDVEHVIRGSTWERELLDIVLNEVKGTYKKYALNDDRGMVPAAYSVFRMARIVIDCYEGSFLRPKDPTADLHDRLSAHHQNDPPRELIGKNAKALVRSFLLPCHLLLLAAKADFNTQIRNLESEHAEKFVAFGREVNGKKFILGQGIVALDDLNNCTPEIDAGKQFKNAVLEAMSGQKKVELANRRNKRLKVTQENIAKRLSMTRTTFESKLANHHLKWKNLKEKIDEQFRQNS